MNVFKKGCKRYVRVKCNKCNGVSEKEASNADGRQGCRYCKHGHPYIEKKTTQQFYEELYEKWGNKIWTNDKYISANTRMEFHCGVNNKHKVWEATPSAILHGRGHGTGCPKCSYVIRGKKKRNNANYFVEKYSKIIKEHGGKLLKVYRKQYRVMLDIECKEGHTWSVVSYSLLHGSWCPQCAGSNMERNMGILLDINNIDYIFQYHRRINGHDHLFDFRLQDINRNDIIIELDGKQHTDSKNRWYRGTERDDEKNKWCKENGFRMIRLPSNTTLNDMSNVLKNVLGYHDLKLPDPQSVPLFKQYKEILNFYLVPEHTLKETANKYHISTEFVKRNTKKAYSLYNRRGSCAACYPLADFREPRFKNEC